MATTKIIAYCSLDIVTDEVVTVATFDMNLNASLFTSMEMNFDFITFFNVPNGIVVILEWNQYNAEGVPSRSSSTFFLELEGNQLTMTRKLPTLHFYDDVNQNFRASNYFHDAIDNSIVWITYASFEGSQTTVMRSFNYNTFNVVESFGIADYLNYNATNLQISHSDNDHIIFFQQSYQSETYVPPQLFYVERVDTVSSRLYVNVPAEPEYWYGTDTSGFYYFDTGVGQLIGDIYSNDLQMVSPDTFGAAGSNDTRTDYEPAKSNLISYFRAKV